MAYIAIIRKNETGEIRRCSVDMEWEGQSMFWWTEGNFGCDCNRELMWLRSNDEDEPEETTCGDSALDVLGIELGDHTLLVDAIERVKLKQLRLQRGA
ncbi:MAG: hypothetical protein KGL39_25250 [Patescibacteria group bacterium]|nr:hypothetical protein [Patescibacteria group bacterium]